jgi:uncharacterized protein YicC (UPF0701 family)
MQELEPGANTLGSSRSMRVSRSAMEMKILIESRCANKFKI